MPRLSQLQHNNGSVVASHEGILYFQGVFVVVAVSYGGILHALTSGFEHHSSMTLVISLLQVAVVRNN